VGARYVVVTFGFRGEIHEVPREARRLQAAADGKRI
jgi:hypothetical protein